MEASYTRAADPISAAVDEACDRGDVDSTGALLLRLAYDGLVDGSLTAADVDAAVARVDQGAALVDVLAELAHTRRV